MSDEIVVHHEAMLAAARREAEKWRTAKDRLAAVLADTETENARLNARVDHVERSLFRESQRVIHAEEALAAECAQHRADYEAALEVTAERDSADAEVVRLREKCADYEAEVSALRTACDNWYQRATAAEAIVRAAPAGFERVRGAAYPSTVLDEGWVAYPGPVREGGVPIYRIADPEGEPSNG